MTTDLPFDLVLLMLRVVFIFLLYFFLYQVVRVISRELSAMPAARPARAAGSATAATPTLTLIDADQSDLPVGATFTLQPMTSVGRSGDNVVALPDAFVSSRHARLTQANGRWYLTDLDSTNGTFVNGARAGQAAEQIKDGDVIQFGRVKLRLSLP
jgi:pSer/pThr/pTyr-binding forkhead associated (FHA) protein